MVVRDSTLPLLLSSPPLLSQGSYVPLPLPRQAEVGERSRRGGACGSLIPSPPSPVSPVRLLPFPLISLSIRER